MIIKKITLALLTALFLFTAPVFAFDRIGVVCNFYPEIKPFLSRIEGEKYTVKMINNVEFFCFAHGHSEVVLFMGGADQASASSTAQLAIDRFNLNKLIISGIAGGVSPDINIGDVAIPARWANHTFGYLAPESGVFADFFKPDPDFPVPYGFLYHCPKDINLPVEKGREMKARMWFDVNSRLMETAMKIDPTDLNLERLSDKAPRIIAGGNGVSGSWFADNYQYRQHLWKYFKADVVDIESQAVCQVAMANGIPMIAVRTVSDYAGNDRKERNAVAVNLFKASKNSSEVVWKLIGLLSE